MRRGRLKYFGIPISDLNQFQDKWVLSNLELVEKNKIQLFDLCDKHRVEKLYVYGSVLTNKFMETSDIDMVVRFFPFDVLEYFDNYMDLKEKMEKLFGKRVDLIEDQSIQNPIFRKILDRENN